MADVQLEHGYVRIANRLYEAVLQAEFREAHLRIVLALIRVTYGWRQRSVRLPTVSSLARLARLNPNGGGFRVAFRELTAEGVIHTYADGTVALQKNFTRWGVFSVAESRLEALFGVRPDPGAVPTSAESAHPRRDEVHPTEDEAHPVQDEPPVLTVVEPTDCESERQGKTEKANIGVIARELSVAANQGLAEHPTKPQLVPRIIATNGHSHEAAAAITQAGVPTDFAKSLIYEAARTHKADGTIKSLNYFVPAVLRGWEEHVAAEEARRTERPALAIANGNGTHHSRKQRDVGESSYQNGRAAFEGRR